MMEVSMAMTVHTSSEIGGGRQCRRCKGHREAVDPSSAWACDPMQQL
jgi:hypothetical protein